MSKSQPDQAAGLRSMTETGGPNQVRVISVTSGKGGVGKTNVVTNLAIALGRMGKRVMVMDADLSLANIDILLGLAPEYHLGHVFNGERKLEEVLVEGPAGIRILPASSGWEGLSAIDEIQKLTLLDQMDTLEDEVDILLIDTAAGIGNNVLYFNQAAQERVVVVTPEPTALTDAYALIKVLSQHQERYFRLLINQVKGEAEAKEVFRKLVKVADRFLSEVSLDYLGFIPTDQAVQNSVRRQRSTVEAFPDSAAAKSFVQLARLVLESPVRGGLEGNIRFFFKRLFSVQESI